MLLLLVEAALHSILLGVATWLGLTLLRIRDAEAEMIVWKIVLVAAVAMPLLVPLARVTIPGGQTFLSPHVDASATSVPDLDWPSPGPTFKAVETLTPGTATPALEPAGRIPVETIDWLDVATGLYLIVPVETIDWLDVATGLYLTVSGVLLLKLLIGLTMTFRLARTARPIEAEWSEGASVRVSESVSLPATFASVVLLPADWETWNTVKRRAVLAHELAHVAHGDFYVLLLAMLYHVAFWFNPLSWWLLHRVRELMEILSDDAAIADLGDAPSYAEVILEVAASVRSTPMLIGMARASTVHRRIERILARTERPPSLGRLKRAWLASGLLPLVAASAVTVASGTPKEQGASIVAQASVPGQPPLRPTDDRALLDSYVGNYERESSAATEPRVFTVIRKDDRLLLKQTGMAIGNGFPLFPKNDRTFTYVPVVGGSESELTFVRGDQGQITTIVVHFVVRGEGEDFTARRVDEAEARRATELHNQRLAAQRQPRVAIRIDPALFDRYVGAYKLSMGQVIVVERDGDQFFLRNEVPGFQRIRIYPESETSYFAEDFHEQINFVTNPQGQVTELIQHMGGWSNTARRIGEAEVRLAEAAIAERSRRLIERRADERRPREAIAVEPSLSDRYTGVYEGAWGAGRQLLTVTREGDQLYTQMGGQAKLPIYPEHEHAFFYKGIPAQLTFVVEGQGMASKVILHHNGHELMSQRIADWPKADRQPPAVDPEILSRYVGWYQLGPLPMLTRQIAAVTREGSHLFVLRPGQERFEVFASSAGVYFSRDNSNWISFKSEGSEPVSEIVFYGPLIGAQRGTRMDDAKGREIQDEITRVNVPTLHRFIAQQPAPGSEAMARKYIDMVRTGTDDALLSPRAADILREQSFLRDELTKLGPLQSLSFRGVMLAGETDIYDATFANGRARIMINLGQDGKLDRANMQAERVGPPGAIIDCAQEGVLKSQVGTSGPITMTVINRSGGDINLFDISPLGDRYSTAIGPRPPIADGQSTQRWGRPSNPMVVTDGAGACLEVVLPGDSTHTVVVRPKGASPRSARGPAVPLPNAEDILRQYIEGVRRGALDYQQMTPWAADVARRSLRGQQALLAKLGTVQAVAFAGISSAEDDIYQVKFDNGSVEWRIDLTPDGKVRRVELGPG